MTIMTLAIMSRKRGTFSLYRRVWLGNHGNSTYEVCIFGVSKWRSTTCNLNEVHNTKNKRINHIVPDHLKFEIASIYYSKSVGLYSCPTRLLRCIKQQISWPLAEIMNHSIRAAQRNSGARGKFLIWGPNTSKIKVQKNFPDKYL
jgi:hypothetical protein